MNIKTFLFTSAWIINILISILFTVAVLGFTATSSKKEFREYQLIVNNIFPSETQEEKGVYLSQPSDFCFDDDDNIWVVDSKLHKALKFNIKGEYIGSFGRMGQGPGEFQRPSEIEIDGDDVVIKDIGNRRIAVLNKKGEFNKSFIMPNSFSWYSVKNKLIYADTYTNEGLIQVMDYDGKIMEIFGKEKIFNNNHRELNAIYIRINNEHNIVTCWRYFPDIRIYNKDRKLITEFGIDDTEIKKHSEENIKTAREVGDPNKIDLMEIISGMYLTDKSIFILAQIPYNLCVFELNYDGKIISKFSVENTTLMVSGLLVKGSGNRMRFFTIEQFPENKIIEFAIK